MLKGSAGCTMMFKLYLEDVLCNTWRSFSKEVKGDFPFSCSMGERLEEGHDQRQGKNNGDPEEQKPCGRGEVEGSESD